MKSIIIHSIFESISGEAGFFPQGTWCTFIRFQGCNLRCLWCDTPQAQSPCKGTRMTIDQILLACNNKHVLITGGEPLRQEKELISLINKLNKRGHRVQVETNGSYKIPTGPRVGWIVDYKCSSSGMSEHMPYLYNFVNNIWITRSIVKFVVDVDHGDNKKNDINQAITVMEELIRREYKRPFIISPKDADGEAVSKIVGKMANYTSLLNNIIFSVQIHKLVNLP
jgi:7-carboxy-7-deazaguanine synthase